MDAFEAFRLGKGDEKAENDAFGDGAVSPRVGSAPKARAAEARPGFPRADALGRPPRRLRARRRRAERAARRGRARAPCSKGTPPVAPPRRRSPTFARVSVSPPAARRAFRNRSGTGPRGVRSPPPRPSPRPPRRRRPPATRRRGRPPDAAHGAEEEHAAGRGLPRRRAGGLRRTKRRPRTSPRRTPAATTSARRRRRRRRPRPSPAFCRAKRRRDRRAREAIAGKPKTLPGASKRARRGPSARESARRRPRRRARARASARRGGCLGGARFSFGGRRPGGPPGCRVQATCASDDFEDAFEKAFDATAAFVVREFEPAEKRAAAGTPSSPRISSPDFAAGVRVAHRGLLTSARTRSSSARAARRARGGGRMDDGRGPHPLQAQREGFVARGAAQVGNHPGRRPGAQDGREAVPAPAPDEGDAGAHLRGCLPGREAARVPARWTRRSLPGDRRTCTRPAKRRLVDARARTRAARASESSRAGTSLFRSARTRGRARKRRAARRRDGSARAAAPRARRRAKAREWKRGAAQAGQGGDAGAGGRVRGGRRPRARRGGGSQPRTG